jgi:deazaflavin-dependent oxidoreductase (nitroreductase family)
LPRQTPLQFEEVDGVYYVASARGDKADWYRNLQADPRVIVQAQGKTFSATAQPITDPVKIADFLELRLQRHPRMMSLMLRAEGLPLPFTRAQLEQLAAEKAVVALHPVPTEEAG